MNKRITSRIILSFIIAVALILSSCPLPITDALVAAIEDSFAPDVEFLSHDEYDYYYSSLTVEGTIQDDALRANDNLGTLKHIEVFVESADPFNGGIIVDTQGGYEIDPSLGDAIINFNAVTGDFSVEMPDTSTLDNDIVVRITATDRNDNSTIGKMSLRSSSGPLVLITSPTNLNYTTLDSILFEGTLSDSSELTTTIDEISTVEFSISTLPPAVILDLATADYNAGTDTYSVEVPQVPGISSDSALFTLSGTTFSCSFYSPDSGMGVAPSLSVTAYDKNGKSGYDDIRLALNEGGPSVTVHEPARSGNFYSSDRNFPSSIVFRASVTSGATDVNEVIIGVKRSTDTIYSTVYTHPVVPFSGTQSNIQTNLNSSSYSGDLRIQISATDTNETTSITRNVSDDSDGPLFDNIRFVETDDTAVQYAKGGDTVQLRFGLSDGSGIGVETSTLSITDPHGLGFNTDLDSQGDGPYDLTFAFPLSSESQDYSDGTISFTVSAIDKVTNEGSADEGDAELIYYHKAPDSPPSVTFTKVAPLLTPSSSSYLRGGERVQARITPGRHLNMSLSKFYFVPDGETSPTELSIQETFSGSGIYTAEYTVDSGDTDGALTWNMTYVDMAGNETEFTGGAAPYTIDNTEPDITDEYIQSNNSSHLSVVDDGDRAEVYFKRSDPDSGSGISSTAPVVDFYGDGSTSSDQSVNSTSQSAGWWRSQTSTMSDTFPQGEITARIYVYDNAGNQATKIVSETLLGSAVTVDTIAPVILGTSTVVSNGTTSGSTSKAAIGDIISVSLKLDEKQRDALEPTISFIIGGQTITIDSDDVEVSGDRLTVTAVYTVPDTATASIPDLIGALTVSTSLRDAWNAAETRTFVSSLSVDNKKPTFLGTTTILSDGALGTGIAGINDTITATLKLSEAQKTDVKPTVSFTIGAETVSIAASEVTVSTDRLTVTIVYTVPDTATGGIPDLIGTLTVNTTIQDNFGNLIAGPRSSTLTVDNEKPTVSITSPSNGAEVNEESSLTVSTSGSTDVASVYFVMQDVTPETDSSVSSGVASVSFTTPDIDSDTAHTIKATATDSHGNVSATDSISVTVKFVD